jgi:hypothetical protein
VDPHQTTCHSNIGVLIKISNWISDLMKSASTSRWQPPQGEEALSPGKLLMGFIDPQSSLSKVGSEDKICTHMYKYSALGMEISGNWESWRQWQFCSPSLTHSRFATCMRKSMPLWRFGQKILFVPTKTWEDSGCEFEVPKVGQLAIVFSLSKFGLQTDEEVK